MKLFTKKRLLLFIGIATVLGLAQCDFVRVAVSQSIHRPIEVEFPMGENRQVSYPIRSWIDKPYAMGLVIEYANWDKSIDHDKQKEIPFSLSASCYRIEKDREVLFFQKHYSKEDEIYMGNGYAPREPHSVDARANWGALGGFRLPYGHYRCDFRDTSSPEIKAYLQKAGGVKTYIVISTVLPFY